jgi:hypothetical protein
MKKTLILMLICLIAPAAVALADSHEDATAQEVKETIMANFEYTREAKAGMPNAISKEGSVEFWSSGGLMNWIAAGEEPGSFDVYSLTPKHIKVITLVPGEAAVAMYYSEGSMHPKGAAPVPHYLTRAMEVYVKEDGKWKVRAAHWSPVAGGSGTSQTALD